MLVLVLAGLMAVAMACGGPATAVVVTPTPGPTLNGASGTSDTEVLVSIDRIEAVGEAVGAERSNAVFLVHVVDDTGAPVAGANFTGRLVTPSGSRDTGGTTGADGVGKITAPVDADGQFKFEVKNITGPGLLYDPGANNATQAVIQSNSASFTIIRSAEKSGTDVTFELKSNRPQGEWIVRTKSGSTVKRGNFKSGNLTDSFTQTMTGCKPNVLEFTATIRTLSGLVTKDASFTITAPPCQMVHVDEIQVFYDYFQIDETLLTFEVQVFDEDGRSVPEGAVTVTGSITRPDGSVVTTDIRTNIFGEANFEESVAIPGIFTFTVEGLFGEGIEHDAAADLASSIGKGVAVDQGFVAGFDQTDRINTLIPLGWESLGEPAFGEAKLLTAPDVFAWKDSQEFSDNAFVPGYTATILDVFPGEEPFSIEILGEMQDELFTYGNCRELISSSSIFFTTRGDGLQETYACDEGGIFTFSVWFQPDSPGSLLIVDGRMITPQQEFDFNVFMDFLVWEPNIEAELQVHVDFINGFYELVDERLFGLTFLVEVADQNHFLISGRPAVTVTGTIFGPGGFRQAVSTPTGVDGIAEFQVVVDEPGVYTLEVGGLRGVGIQHDPSVAGASSFKVVILGILKFIDVKDDTGRIQAEIPVSWLALTAPDDGAPTLMAAPDIFAWFDSLDSGGALEIPGLAAVIIDEVSDEVGSASFLLDSLSDPEFLPSNCQDFIFRNDELSFGQLDYVEDFYQCQDGGVLIVGAQLRMDLPDSVLLLVARTITEQDENVYLNFIDTLFWEPLTKFKVSLFDGAAFVDDRTGDLVFEAQVEDSNGFFVFAPVVIGTFRDPSGAIFSFETKPVGQFETTTSFAIDPSTLMGGTYTFTVTDIFVPEANYDPSQDRAGPTFQATVADIAVHLFDGFAFFDDLTGDLVFEALVEDSDGLFVFAPVVSGFYEDPLGNFFIFDTKPFDDFLTSFTIGASALMGGTYTFTVTDIFIPGAIYDASLDHVGPNFQAVVPDLNITVHLFDGGAFVDFDQIGDVVFLAVVKDSEGFFAFAPVVIGFYQDPSGAIFKFKTVPDPLDEIVTTFTIKPAAAMAGTYTFTVTDIFVPGATYDPSLDEIGPTFQAEVPPGL